MLRLKPEGTWMDPEAWTIQHPARWCKVRWFLAVVRSYSLRKMGSPYAEAWTAHGHVWTCYMRLRGPWVTGWRAMLPGAKRVQSWGSVKFFHEHKDFTDPIALQNMVKAGLADDPFIDAKFIGRVVLAEDCAKEQLAH